MKFFYNDIVLEIPEGVYFPEEDSLLLADIIEKADLKNKKILDMGSGSGFLAILAAKMGGGVVACDISNAAVDAVKANSENNHVNMQSVRSDLFFNIEGTFDLIIFNPPYLPESEEDKSAKGKKTYGGGKTGRDVIEKFAKHARKFLVPGGKVFMVMSSLTGEKEVFKVFERNGFDIEIVKKTKIPWEELIAFMAVSARNRQ